MKPAVLLFLLLSGIPGCVEEMDFRLPLPAEKYEKIEIIYRTVNVSFIVTAPTPCYYFAAAERNVTSAEAIVKVIGNSTGDPCIQVVSQLKVFQQFYFDSEGEKRIRLWRGEGDYIDTLITLL